MVSYKCVQNRHCQKPFVVANTIYVLVTGIADSFDLFMRIRKFSHILCFYESHSKCYSSRESVLLEVLAVILAF
jgi:hypothetical protein